MLHALLRKHVPDLTEKRPRTADGDPEVVEKLGIEIRAKAGFRTGENAKQCPMDLAGADVRTHRRQEFDARRRDIASHRNAELPQHEDVRTLGTGLNPGTTFDDCYQP